MFVEGEHNTWEVIDGPDIVDSYPVIEDSMGSYQAENETDA